MPGREHSQRRRLLEAHKAAAEFYAGRLHAPDAAPGRAFLAERGFALADAEHFGVGYAPAEWEALTRHLRGRGFTEQELLTGGLASQGRRGAMDRFRGRLMWPIRDLTGERDRFRRPQAQPGRGRPEVPEHAGDTPVPEKHRAVRGGPGQTRDRRAPPGGHRRGLHRRDGLPPGRGQDCGGHLRHLVRRRSHQDPPPAADGRRPVPRRGHLHLRRRRGRADAPRCARSTSRSTSSPRPSSRYNGTAWTRATCG